MGKTGFETYSEIFNVILNEACRKANEGNCERLNEVSGDEGVGYGRGYMREKLVHCLIEGLHVYFYNGTSVGGFYISNEPIHIEHKRIDKSIYYTMNFREVYFTGKYEEPLNISDGLEVDIPISSFAIRCKDIDLENDWPMFDIKYYKNSPPLVEYLLSTDAIGYTFNVRKEDTKDNMKEVIKEALCKIDEEGRFAIAEKRNQYLAALDLIDNVHNVAERIRNSQVQDKEENEDLDGKTNEELEEILASLNEENEKKERELNELLKLKIKNAREKMARLDEQIKVEREKQGTREN